MEGCEISVRNVWHLVSLTWDLRDNNCAKTQVQSHFHVTVYGVTWSG